MAGPWTVEIAAAGVSKAAALAELCEELGVMPAEVVAFGDYPNDLPMLEWAGHAVAVANAHPEVLAAVTEVTASNDDDGVAVVLDPTAQPEEKVILAGQGCPTQAITIIKDGEKIV
jgi:hydroxymethylpyrimidine pyrophosphatase-like HAD family hydrolase